MFNLNNCDKYFKAPKYFELVLCDSFLCDFCNRLAYVSVKRLFVYHTSIWLLLFFVIVFPLHPIPIHDWQVHMLILSY